MPTPAPRAAKPSKSIFDPFNSSATGHQRAENRLSGSTSWRDSKTLKLNEQFGSSAGGGKRVNDTVGAGSLEFGKDGRTANGGWEKGAKGLRTAGQLSILQSFAPNRCEDDTSQSTKPLKNFSPGEDARPTKMVNPFTPFVNDNGSLRENSWTSHEAKVSHDMGLQDWSTLPQIQRESRREDSSAGDHKLPQIFKGLSFYINGSTAPLISDHKLKKIISSHGGRVNVALQRRTVTHIIVSKPSSSGGRGGGLAASKLHKEITHSRVNGMKLVTAQWVTECVAAGKRLPESRFESINLKPKGVSQVNVYFGKQGAKPP